MCFPRMRNEKNAECVKVVVRCRPLFGKELNEGRHQIVFMDRENAMATLKKPGQEDSKSA